MQANIRPKHFDKLIPEPGPDPKSPARLTTLPQPTKNIPKQKDLSRTEQRYVGRTAVKVTVKQQLLVLTCSLRVESLHTLFEQ